MLDMKFIRENPDLVRAACAKKRFEVDLDALLALDETRRGLISELDSLRNEQKSKSSAIGKLPQEQRAEAALAVKQLKEDVKALEVRAQEVEDQIRPLALRVPNIPSDDVPDGKDDQDNVEIKRWGDIPTFDFELRDHLELARLHQGVDIDRASRIAGSRNYFLMGFCVELERAILQFAMDHMIQKGFIPLQVPLLMREEAMIGTAYFPGGEEQAYQCERDELSLVGTAEVPMTAYHLGEILKESDLPRKFVAASPCFRREAGTYGKDTKGFYRVHQFMKVEQVIVAKGDEAESLELHQQILGNSEEVVRAMELPYRVVNVCGGDLGLPQVQKFDIECWMPSRAAYGETHSASRFHDFQARRLGLRYRDQDGKVQHCHTLNNTVVASPRILIPFLENHQKADGSIHIPVALGPYLSGREVVMPPNPE